MEIDRFYSRKKENSLNSTKYFLRLSRMRLTLTLVSMCSAIVSTSASKDAFFGFQIGALLWLLHMASTFLVLIPIFPLLWEIKIRKTKLQQLYLSTFVMKKYPNQKNQNKYKYIYVWNRSIIEGYLRMRFYNLHLNQRRMCTMFLSLLLAWFIHWNNY